jgi:uncharacterized membrane protein
MLYMPLLTLHIACSLVGLLSGFTAMFFRKGSGLHAAAGTVFFVSMLGMSTSAVYIAAFLKPIMINVVAGSLTFYLVTTGWKAAKDRRGKTNLFDRGALVFALVLAAFSISSGFKGASATGVHDGLATTMFFVFGTITLLLAVSDIRMLIRGGVNGSQRIKRHLWRMGLALLLTTLSAQGRLYPKWIRGTALVYVPILLLLGSLLFWLYRLSARKRAAHGRELSSTTAPATVAGPIAAGGGV